MPNQHLVRKMRELQDELRNLDAASSFSLLNEKLAFEGDPLFAFEMKITKATLLCSEGKRGAETDLLAECARDPFGDESAAYFAAEILVEGGRILESIEFLESAERQMAESGSDYFKGCTYLLHAYCEAKIGNPRRALELLENVTDQDEALVWLKVDDFISVHTVREITSR